MPHLDSVYRMARRLTHDPADAEDMVQETFLKAYAAFENFQLRDYGAKPWLFKILHNVFYSRLGQQTRSPTLMEDADFENLAAQAGQPSESQLGAATVNWEQFDSELKAAVDELGTEYREVLLLWALESLSYKEIAEVCGIPIGTVMSRLYRARQQVAQRLANYARQQNLSNERVQS